MGKLHKSQSGFGGVEALLFLVIIGIIGFTGWYVWNSKANTDKNLTAVSSTTPIVKKSTTPTASTADATSYLTIKEWGVKIPVSNGLKGLTYSFKAYDDGTQIVGFTFPSLKNTECNDDQSVGALVRFTASDIDPLSGDKLTSENPGVKQIGTYYYTVGLPQATCTNDTATQNIVTNARQPLTDAIKNIQKA
jgi:hypothetical protein